MSIPKNHHYVSQCLVRQFFNEEEGRIFIYDKELNNHYSKTTSKSLFSEEFLNSKEIHGKIDHHRLELELKVLIEDKFPNHLKTVKAFISNQSYQDNANESLIWLSMLGAIGELRHPAFKKSLDSIKDLIEDNLRNDAGGDASHLIDEYFPKNQKTKYLNALDYINSACDVLEMMEPLVFGIYFIESDDSFILPDTSCFQIRGQFYPNLGRFIDPIIQIGFPISPKIFILTSSKIIAEAPSGICFIRKNNSEIVDKINNDLFGFAYKAIVSPNQQYLKNFIKSVQIQKAI